MIHTVSAALKWLAAGRQVIELARAETIKDEVGNRMLGGGKQVEAAPACVCATVQSSGEAGDSHSLLGSGDGPDAVGCIVLPEMQ